MKSECIGLLSAYSLEPTLPQFIKEKEYRLEDLKNHRETLCRSYKQVIVPANSHPKIDQDLNLSIVYLVRFMHKYFRLAFSCFK